MRRRQVPSRTPPRSRRRALESFSPSAGNEMRAGAILFPAVGGLWERNLCWEFLSPQLKSFRTRPSAFSCWFYFHGCRGKLLSDVNMRKCSSCWHLTHYIEFKCSFIAHHINLVWRVSFSSYIIFFHHWFLVYGFFFKSTIIVLKFCRILGS